MLFPTIAGAEDFSPESRVWVYTASRPLEVAEVRTAQEALNHFVRQWTAHNQALKAVAEVFQNQFVILMVDESQAGASGCSIDKSVHFLETLGQRLHVDFFERMRFAWADGGTLHFSDRDTLRARVGESKISDNTLMVNTLVQNKKELQEKWLIPFSQSWHRRLI
ncbi:MAG: hypothetical protein L6Q97_07690 [Thermoanaerobaculia bacterium]|nr:hypothetical protein [Thermoanaerobaculia bacterium]